MNVGIGKKVGLIVITQITCAALGYVALVTILRCYGDAGPRVYGVLSGGLAIFGLFGFIQNMGFRWAHMKRISEGNNLGTCIGTFAAIEILLTVVMMLVILTVGHLPGSKILPIVSALVIYALFIGLRDIGSITFDAKRETAKSQVTLIAETVIRLMVIVPMALLTLSVAWLARAYVVGILASFFVALFLMKEYIPVIKRPTRSFLKTYWTFAGPMCLLSMIIPINTNINTMLLLYLRPLADVGCYAAMDRIRFFLAAIPGAIGMLLLPTISFYHVNSAKDDIKALMSAAMRYASMIMFPIVVLILILNKPIIHILLSDAVLPGAPALCLLAVSLLFWTLSTPYIALVGGIERRGLGATMGAAMCCTNAALSLVLIPSYGPLGAATAVLIASVVGFVIVVFAPQDGLAISWRPIGIHLLAAVVMGSFLYLLLWLGMPSTRGYHLLVLSVVGVGAYLGVLVALHEFRRWDLKFLTRILYPGEMRAYVLSELEKK